jgi:N-acetylglucosamine malate deacetylase 1
MKKQRMRRFIQSGFFVCFLILGLFGQTHATIVVIAPHPDDAEASCGGLILNAIESGEDVVILTMTGGELGIYGKNKKEALAIRTEEARNGANILGAKIEFFGEIDASLAVDSASLAKLKKLLLRMKPTVVLAPWPLDVHADHQASGILAWRAFQDRVFTFDLYFYETSNEPHTMSFQFFPSDYVDITKSMSKKKEAVFQHKSQSPENWFPMYEVMAKFRGYEADVTYAEGYLKAQNSSGMGGRRATRSKTLSGNK